MRRLRSDDPGHHVVPGGLLRSRPHHEGLGQEDCEPEVVGMASLGGPQNGLGGGGVAGIFQGPAEQGEGRGRQLGQGGRPGKVPEGRPARLAGLAARRTAAGRAMGRGRPLAPRRSTGRPARGPPCSYRSAAQSSMAVARARATRAGRRAIDRPTSSGGCRLRSRPADRNAAA